MRRDMENDYEGAQQREKGTRNASSRKRRWLTRDWRVSKGGNPFLNADGYNIVVYPAGSRGWNFRVKNCFTEKGVASRQPLITQDAAKLRAFDAMVWMKQRGQ